MPIKAAQSQVEKTFEQILDLLEELILHAAEEDLEEDEGVDVSVMMEALVEEAGERGLDEEQVERIFRMIWGLARKS